MSTVHGAISFFELGVGDAAAGRTFYEGLFAWNSPQGRPGTGGS